MTLVDLIARETGKSYERKTKGGEYCGPCPWCGGDDRFDIWANDRPRYWCRGCKRKGDAIQFLRDYSGLPFAQAKERAERDGLAEPDHGDNATPRPEGSPTASRTAGDAPTGAWAERAAGFLTDCQAALWADLGARIWDYLRSRTLKTATVEWAGLGYHAADRWEDRECWGLPPEADKNGRPKRVWLPRGLVIPWQLDGELWGLRIRRPTKPGDNLRYYALPTPGHPEPLYLADQIDAGAPGARPAMLLEGELDALTVWQAAGDLVAPAATGSTERGRRVRWLSRLATAPAVLVAFDADKGGEDGAAYWLDALSNAQRWRPFWSDANDMARSGVDLRAWVVAGMGYAGLALPEPSGSPLGAGPTAELEQHPAGSRWGPPSPYPPLPGDLARVFEGQGISPALRYFESVGDYARQLYADPPGSSRYVVTAR